MVAAASFILFGFIISAVPLSASPQVVLAGPVQVTAVRWRNTRTGADSCCPIMLRWRLQSMDNLRPRGRRLISRALTPPFNMRIIASVRSRVLKPRGSSLRPLRPGAARRARHCLCFELGAGRRSARGPALPSHLIRPCEGGIKPHAQKCGFCEIRILMV